MPRTLDEICDRLRQPGDMLGWRFEVLAPYLPADRITEFATIKDGVDWEPSPLDDASILKELADYLDFAWGKALDHRGISASRSIDKLTEWLWLLGNQEALDRFTAAGYGPYGAPKLAELSRFLERPIPNTNAAHRMAEGLPCSAEGCWDGCSS